VRLPAHRRHTASAEPSLCRKGSIFGPGPSLLCRLTPGIIAKARGAPRKTCKFSGRGYLRLMRKSSAKKPALSRPDGGPMLSSSAPVTSRSPVSTVQEKAPQALPRAKSWSVYQEAVFRDVAEGTGHTVVRARAGSGKTTTIIEAFGRVPAGLSVLMVAFNKSIAQELQSRAPAGVTVSTLHSYGFAAIRSAFGSVRLDNRKTDALIVGRVGDAKETREYRTALAKAISLAKGTLASSAEEIEELVDEFGLDIDDEQRAAFCRDAIEILAQCKADTKAIDFDDMIWFPVVYKLRVRKYDRVFVDETQDLNACQIELALAACARGGRICAVGDDRQAIYGFRGADSNAMDRVIDGLGAKVFPLSVTYRCARSIVDVAKEIVPDLEAAPGAIGGEVLSMSVEAMRKHAGPGDFVLSRTNAPIVSLCLGFLKEGKPATVAGRDVGAGLRALVEKSKAATIPALAEWLDTWRDREIERVTKRRHDADTTGIEDRAACIHALCEGAASVAEVIAKIESLFSDADNENRIVCSTTHKAKGLERDRVFVLAETYRAQRSKEEANLWYVAVTRARRTLCIVQE
jgi:ATP-dependent DNA helicase UvrD/PcrA